MTAQKASDRVRIVKLIVEGILSLAIIGAVLYSCTRDRDPAPVASSESVP